MSRASSTARTGITLAILATLAGVAAPRGLALAAPVAGPASVSHVLTAKPRHLVTTADSHHASAPTARVRRHEPARTHRQASAHALPRQVAAQAKLATLRVPQLHSTFSAAALQSTATQRGGVVAGADRLHIGAIRPAVAATFVVPAACPGAPAGATPEPTIQQALNAAHAGDTIDICPGTYTLAGSFLSNSYLVALNNLTIQGVGATPATVVIDATPIPPATQSAGFTLAGSGDMLRNLTVENATGPAGAPGYGVVVAGANVTLTDVALTNNDVGAYVLGSASATLNGVTESSNTTNQVAGLWVDGGTATVGNDGGGAFSSFDNNTSGNGIGAYVQDGGTLNATGARFAANSYGIGSPSGSTATIVLSNDDVSGNSLAGVVINGGGTLTSTSSDFNNDVVAGIYVGTVSGTDAATTVTLTNSVATGDSFGVAVQSATATTISVNGLTASGNLADGLAFLAPISGPIGAVSSGAGGLNNMTVNGNGDAGLYDEVPGSLTIANSNFDGNGTTGASSNGGIAIQPTVNGAITLNNVTANGNTGDGLGYLGAGALTVNTGTFNNNTGTDMLGFSSVGIDVATTNATATLNTVTANGNDDDGVASESNGLLTLNGGTFNGNGSSGVYVSQFTAAPYGINTPVTFSNVTANNNGGDGFTYDESGTGAVTGSGTNTFDGNAGDGLYVGTGNTGALNLSGVTADGNATDGLENNSNGAVTLSNSTFGATGAGNALYGAHIYGTFTSVSVSGVTADANADNGLSIDGAGTGPISITGGGHFDGNGTTPLASGVFISTGNANTLTIGDSTHSITANGNSEDGFDLRTNGTDTITGVTANGNGTVGDAADDEGLYDTGSGRLTVTNSTFGAAGAGNVKSGIYLDSATGTMVAVTLTNVSASHNGLNGLENGTTVTGGITVDPSHFDNNAADGIGDFAAGALTISGDSASARTTLDNNGLWGLHVDDSAVPALVIQVPVTLTYVEANGNGYATGNLDGAGVQLDGMDSITASNSLFDANFSTGVAVYTHNMVAASFTFTNDTFNGNATTGASANAGGTTDNAGLAVDTYDATTSALTVTGSTLNDNGNNGHGGSGVFLYGPSSAQPLNVTLQGNVIQGNDTAQALNAASNYGGITLNGYIGAVNTTPASLASPVAWSAYNHINGNGVGVVIASSFTGNLSYNDITGNKAAGIEIVGSPALTGVTSVSNSIYGGAFDAVPTPLPGQHTLSVSARPGTPPYYGYVNFGSGSGLDLAGNWFGIGGTFTAGDFAAAYAGPSHNCPANSTNAAACSPATSATLASYIDIGGFWRSSGPFITLSLSVPTTNLISGLPASLSVSATLSDGHGHTVIDGTPVAFFIFNGTTQLGTIKATTVHGVATATLSFTTPINTTANFLPLQVVATAPDRGVADVALTTVQVYPGNQNCTVHAAMSQADRTLRVTANPFRERETLITGSDSSTAFQITAYQNLVVGCAALSSTDQIAVLQGVATVRLSSQPGMPVYRDTILVIVQRNGNTVSGSVQDLTAPARLPNMNISAPVSTANYVEITPF